MKFIELTDFGAKTAINVDYISGIEQNPNGGCNIYIMDNSSTYWNVEESYQEVIQKIREVSNE